MTDYPAHLAAWHVMLDGGRSADLARFYRFEWHWAPNLGTDLLIRPLAALLGLEAAGRLIAGLVPALLAASLLTAEWALRRRIGPGGLLALATVWSPALLMGFLNFGLALALAVLAFALWIAGEGKAWQAPVFLLTAPLVWLCHLSGWGVLGVLVFGYEWQRRGSCFRALLPTWPLWPPLALSLVAGAGASGALAWGDGVVMDKLSNWAMGLRDQRMGLDLLTVALLAIAPLYAWAKGHADGRIGRAALLLALLSFLLPRHLGGGDFADYRLVPVALACGCLSIDWRTPRLWLALAALPFLLRLALTTQTWIADSRRTEELLGALDLVPRGAMVAGATAEESFAWRQPPFSHVFAWATIRRDALTNAHFAIPGVHMLQLARPDPGFADPSQRILIKAGEAPDLAAFAPAARAQFLWYAGEVPPSRLPAGAQVIWRAPHGLLARLANGAATR